MGVVLPILLYDCYSAAPTTIYSHSGTCRLKKKKNYTITVEELAKNSQGETQSHTHTSRIVSPSSRLSYGAIVRFSSGKNDVLGSKALREKKNKASYYHRLACRI